MAVVLDVARDARSLLLCKQRRLDELDRKADLQMPLDVAMEEPYAGVVHDHSAERVSIPDSLMSRDTYRSVAEPMLSIWMVSRRSGFVWFAKVMTDGSSEV
jgi:hypothetical protein